MEMNMKKIYSLFLVVSVIISIGFSKNFLSERFFEYQIGVPVDISNNAINLDDIFQKTLTLDLTKIAEEMPSEGLNIIVNTKPYMAINLNIACIHIGMKAGVDVYEKMGISKDLFDFLGKGNEVGETLTFDFNNYTDLFAFCEADVGIDFDKFSIHVIPSLFAPVFSSSGSIAKVTFLNDEEGNIIFTIDTDVSVYSNLDAFNEKMVSDLFSSGTGFDMGVAASLPFGSKLTFSGTARFPIVPGSYKYVYSSSYETTMTMNILDSASNSSDSDGNIQDLSKEVLNERVYINRPMKFNLYANYYPMGNIVQFCAGAGIGVYHPFLNESFVYPEYYLSAGVNLIDLIKASISTEYTNQIFKHQIAFGINIRLIEIDCGVSLQSTNLMKSFSNNGFGAYAIVSIGF